MAYQDVNISIKTSTFIPKHQHSYQNITRKTRSPRHQSSHSNSITTKFVFIRPTRSPQFQFTTRTIRPSSVFILKFNQNTTKFVFIHTTWSPQFQFITRTISYKNETRFSFTHQSHLSVSSFSLTATQPVSLPLANSHNLCLPINTLLPFSDMMFNLGFKWHSADEDGKLKIVEYELAGILVVFVIGVVVYLFRRKYKQKLGELRTLQAIVPV